MQAVQTSAVESGSRPSRAFAGAAERRGSGAHAAFCARAFLAAEFNRRVPRGSSEERSAAASATL
jgi:hypothetical protein